MTTRNADLSKWLGEPLTLGALDDVSRSVIGSNAEALARFIEERGLAHDAIFLRFLATLALDGDNRIRDLVNSEAALVEALRATRLELSWCAAQLAARGLPGRTGDSVHRALNKASAALARATDPAEGAGG